MFLHFKQQDDGGIYFFNRIWIPSVGGVRKLIMDEAHTSRYSVHPGADKMYYDLRDLYWWPGMKREISEYVSKCLTCSKIKAEHQKPSGLHQQPEIPEWKWEKITMKLVTKLPKRSSGYDAIWVIIDRPVGSTLTSIMKTTRRRNIADIILNIKIDENLRFVEEPIEIVDRDVKKQKRRRIPLVKVCWNSRQGAE
ncbi:putative reverse transcriptase domain-containing protein [Tanacetum coccineum]